MEKGEFLYSPNGEIIHNTTLEDKMHDVKVKKSLLSKDKIIVDGKTYTGKKKGKTFIAEKYKPNQALKTLGVSVLGLSALISSYACKPIIDDTKNYNLTVRLADIFTSHGLSGTVIVNGESKPSGNTFILENGKINSLDVIASRYNTGYIVGRDSTNQVIYIRDASGPHPATIASDKSIYAYLIPENFDTVLLAKSVGMLNGVIQNYNKYLIKVGIMKWTTNGLEPTQYTINTLKEGIKRVNLAANNVIKLEYVGKINSELSDGVTHLVWDDFALHNEHVSGNVITSSWLGTKPDVSFHLILGELTQASTGLRQDVEGMGFAYLSGDIYNPTWINDGERAIQLANLLPPGFRLSKTAVPAVEIQYNNQYLQPGEYASPTTPGMPRIIKDNKEIKKDSHKKKH